MFPKENPWLFYLKRKRLLRELGVTHGVRWYASYKGFCKDSTPSKVEDIAFPPSKLRFHVINNVLKIPIDRSLMVNRKTQVSPQNSLFLNIQNINTFGSSVIGAIF